MVSSKLERAIEHWGSVYIIARVHADMPHVGLIDEGSKAPLDANTLFCISLLTQRLPGNDRVQSLKISDHKEADTLHVVYVNFFSLFATAMSLPGRNWPLKQEQKGNQEKNA